MLMKKVPKKAFLGCIVVHKFDILTGYDGLMTITVKAK